MDLLMGLAYNLLYIGTYINMDIHGDFNGTYNTCDLQKTGVKLTWDFVEKNLGGMRASEREQPPKPRLRRTSSGSTDRDSSRESTLQMCL